MISFQKKYPAVVFVIPLVAGILLSYFSGLDLSLLPSWLLLSILCFQVLLILFIYKPAGKNRMFLYSYMIILLLYGLFSFQYRYHYTEMDNISSSIEDFKDRSAKVKGVLIQKPEVKDDRIRLSIELINVDDQSKSGIILATIYQNKYKESPLARLQYGDIVELQGKLENLPHQRNPGEFDYGKYLRMHGIDAVFTSYGFDNITLAGHEDPGFYYGHIINPVKDYSIAVIDSLVGGDEGEYLKGLVLGERSNISPEMKENFINAGVAHIIAVSGLNVAYVIIIIWGLLIFVPVRYSYKVIIIILCLLFYMNLTGNTPSIIRATIMASVFMLAQLIERKPNSFNIVAFAAMVILLFDPRQLFDAGFILSFSAILSIIIIYPVLEGWLENLDLYVSLSKGGSIKNALRQVVILFIGTLAAQLGTLPVTAIMFKKISIVSLASNLFAIPLSNIALAVGFIMIIFSTFSTWLASVFASFNSVLMWLQLWLIEVCAKWDYAFIETYFVDSLLFLFYYLVLIFVLGLKKHNFVFRFVSIFLIIINFVIWKDVLSKSSNAIITYLDTGTSGSTLIKLPGGTSVLINPGSSGLKYTSAERNIIPFLKSSDVSSIDLLVINKMGVSEFRSLDYLCKHFKINKILVPDYYRQVMENKKLSPSASSQNIQFITSSKIVNQKGNFRLYIYYDSLYKASSMLSEFVYGDTRLMFDDSDDLAENMINSARIPVDEKVNVLKVSGTGSFDKTSSVLLVSTQPEFAIIQNRVKGRRSINPGIFRSGLSHFGINVVNVTEEGAAIFETDGINLTKYEWKE